jgi:SAM-dependent methyltransferase
VQPSKTSTQPLYDAIGLGYGRVRRPDPRIRRRIHDALGDARRVLDVGAGAGSYEPTDRSVVAVEPSTAMIAQRLPGSAPVLRALADRLPFAGGAFDAAMASLTVHHWADPRAGLAELRRVTTGPVVVLTFDRAVHAEQWLVTDYLEEMRELDAHLPSPDAIAAALGGGSVGVVPVPFDCLDGFCHAWWRRPEAYLDPAVRAGISGIARLPRATVAPAMARLAADLASGAWHRAHQDFLALDEIDAGYRIVTAPGS